MWPSLCPSASFQGTISVKVSVPIVNDSIPEGDETFTVAMSEFFSDEGASVDNSDTATVTISDNDGGAALTIDNVEVSEGEGDGTATISVVLDKAVVDGFTVRASTAVGSDYTAVANRLLPRTDVAKPLLADYGTLLGVGGAA